MLSRRLRRKGYEVVVAADGQEGVHKPSKERRAIILMDVPVLDGWEATRRLTSS